MAATTVAVTVSSTVVLPSLCLTAFQKWYVLKGHPRVTLRENHSPSEGSHGRCLNDFVSSFEQDDVRLKMNVTFIGNCYFAVRTDLGSFMLPAAKNQKKMH